MITVTLTSTSRLFGFAVFAVFAVLTLLGCQVTLTLEPGEHP